MRLLLVFICVFIFFISTFGQFKQKVGEILITDSLEHFEIKNDSLVDIAFNRLWTKYSINSDTLILKANAYDGGTFLGSFKILKNNIDTLIIHPIRFDKPNIYKHDTIKFISIAKRIVPVKEFEYLRIDEYGTWGSKRLIITKDKKVAFSNMGYYSPNEPATNVIHFNLTERKFAELIDTLTNCLIFMIPYNKKVGNVFDPSFIDFTFRSNGEYFQTKRINLSFIHFILYKYLILELMKNQ